MDVQRLVTKHERRLKPVTLWLVGLNVLLVISLLIVISLIRRSERPDKRYVNCAPEVDNEDDGAMIMKKEYNRYCFRSSERGCLDRGYDLKQENNKTVCCGNAKEHMYSVLSEGISRRLRVDGSRAQKLGLVKRYMAMALSDPSAALKRPAAHVGILQNGNLTVSDSEAPRIQWEESGETSFVSGGVIHGGDRLRVTKPGFYYVYTGLQFDVGPPASPTSPMVAFLFKHEHGRSDTQQKLMMSRESSCRQTRGDDVTAPVSMYMAGIYLLRHGDEVSVMTSGHSLLHRSTASTYFGVHMV